MTVSSKVVIDWVFMPIYAILFAGALLCAFRHGFNRATGFFSLVLFAAFRVSGTVILTVEYYQKDSNVTAVVWGYILQGLGYSFLVTSTIAFLTNVYTNSGSASTARPKLLRTLYLANIAALVFLIIGFSSSTDSFDGKNAPLDWKAKVGDIIFAAITLLCGVFALYIFPRTSSSSSSRAILLRVVLALPLMAVRIGYGTWHTFQTPFLGVNQWIQLCLDYIPEVIVVALYISIGFIRRDVEGKAEFAIPEYYQQPHMQA